MSNDRSSISKARSYKEIGEFWDCHDLGDYRDQIQPVEAGIEVEDELVYYPVDRALSGKIRCAARKHGVSSQTLLNLWLQEKVGEESA